jgi:uncharacterized protein (TIRG00374 family)
MNEENRLTDRISLRTIAKFFQWLVALGAFWYVARQISWGEMGRNLITLGVSVILILLFITILGFGSMFLMWYTLLNQYGETGILTTVRVDLVIKFINHIVPSKASGHTVAPLVIKYYTEVDWTEAISIAGVNTGLYASLYGLTGFVGIAYFWLFTSQISAGWLTVLFISVGIYLTVGALVLLAGCRLDLVGAFINKFERTAAKIPKIGTSLTVALAAIPSFTADSAIIFRDLSFRPLVVIPYTLGWTGTLVIFPSLRVWILLTELGGDFSPVILLPIILVMAYSVTILPLTPGGVGIAEASATAVLVAFGVTPELAATVILIDRSLGAYLPAILGAIPMATLDMDDLMGDSKEI